MRRELRGFGEDWVALLSSAMGLDLGEMFSWELMESLERRILEEDCMNRSGSHSNCSLSANEMGRLSLLS